MALDALCLAAALREARQEIIGGRIDRIAQPGPHDVVLSVRGNTGNVKVLLSADPAHPGCT